MRPMILPVGECRDVEVGQVLVIDDRPLVREALARENAKQR